MATLTQKKISISTEQNEFLENYKQWGIKSIAIPLFECCDNGLTFLNVFPIILVYAQKMDIPVEIYGYLTGR